MTREKAEAVSRIYSELAVARLQIHEMTDQIRILRARLAENDGSHLSDRLVDGRILTIQEMEEYIAAEIGLQCEIGYEAARTVLVHDAAVAIYMFGEDELERFAADWRRAGRNGAGPIRDGRAI